MSFCWASFFFQEQKYWTAVTHKTNTGEETKGGQNLLKLNEFTFSSIYILKGDQNRQIDSYYFPAQNEPNLLN